jgi:uncharacterized protein
LHVIGILSTGEIEELLRRNKIGRLAMCQGAFPYVVPINYGYDGDAFYGFSGPGRKIEIMRAQPNVALLVDEIDGPGQWRSVIVEGTFEELTDAVQRKQGIRVITLSGPQLVTRGISAEAGLVLYRIKPAVISGRFERNDVEVRMAVDGIENSSAK